MCVFGKYCVPATYIVILVCTQWADAQSIGSPSDKDVRSVLASQWRKQSTEVVSGQGALRIYRYFDPAANKVRREDISDILERPDPTAKADFTSRIEALLPKTGWNKKLLWGYPVAISFEGSKVRNESTKQYAGLGLGLRTEIVVFDGENESQLDPLNNQVTILPGRSPLEKFAARDLKLVPDAYDLDAYEVHEAAGPAGAVDLVRGPLTITAEPSTGFVRRLVVKDEFGKRPVQETIQYNPIQYADGITLPKRMVRAKYVKGFVEVLTIIEIKKMELNDSVPESSFTLAAPAKATVVDMRKDAKLPIVFANSKPAPDVIKATNIRNERVESQRAIASRPDVLVVSVFIVGAGFLLLGFWVLRGRRPKGAV